MSDVQENLPQAVAILRGGGLVAFPTETVYGLGADAANPAAMARLYAVKGRPRAHPVIVHLGRIDWLRDWARDVPEFAHKLALAFWPGPLTLVLKRAEGVADALTGGQDTVGVRVPAHPLALALLAAFGGGIAAPSANRFGRVSPTTAAHVREDLGGDVDLVLDGGPCAVGIESTIVDASGAAPVILRPGQVSASDIERVAGVAPAMPSGSAPRSPGTLAAHYAPRRPLRLVRAADWEAVLRRQSGKRLGTMSFRSAPPGLRCEDWIRAAAEPERYARELYANLRRLDASGCELILVEAPPGDAPWTGVNDRLARAASGEMPSAP